MIRPLPLLLAALLALLPSIPASADDVRRIAIDPAKPQGTWEGWGVSLAWWAAVHGDRDDLADALFTTKPVTFDGKILPGLGLNIVRYNAGASSWNKIGDRQMVKSKIIFRYRQMEGFWLDGSNPDPDSTSWDWSVDAKQRAMLAKAKQRGVNQFELFSNSPMWWMTKNDNPSGGPKPSDDNLAPEHERNFAIYLAVVARRAADQWGVPFTTVSPFNEPRSDWWFADCKQEGCHVSAPAQARILKLVREELDRRDLQALPISASEETHYDHAIGTWESFDKATRALIGQVNVHGYQEANGDREKLHRLVHTEGGKPLWNSEYGDGDPSGLNMARNLHRDIARLRPTSWSYWQAIDSGGWGLIASNLRRSVVRFEVNPKWHVLAQYTRNIPRGSVILTTGDESAICAFDPKLAKLTLVCLNDSDKARDAEFDFSAFAASGRSASRWLTEPNGKTRYQPLDALPFEKKLAVKLAPKSVVTLVIDRMTVK
ncbi:MAG: glycoside hydrolase [Verrucomicrobiota bacterium]